MEGRFCCHEVHGALYGDSRVRVFGTLLGWWFLRCMEERVELEMH